MSHVTLEELEAGLSEICQSPKDEGVLDLIVRRPQVGKREVLDSAELSPTEGLVGDRWGARHSKAPPDPETQLTLMNSRAIALVARDKERWAQAGDQLFVDFDLSGANVPPGTQLTIGEAVIQVAAPPHTGCSKFMSRFGPDALTFVNSRVGRQLNLRGINAHVVRPGVIRVGDVVTKLKGPSTLE